MRALGYLLILAMILSIPALADRGAVLDAFAAQKTISLEKEAAGIARAAIAAHLAGKPVPKISAKSPLFECRAGVFVTLRIGDRNCGCMGNLDSREKDIAREIASNAVAAAAGDARYHPVRADELPKIRYYISIVGKRRRVNSLSEIDPVRHGLLVEWNGRGGVLLPGEARTAHWQVKECRRKAGIPPDGHVSMFVFETVLLEYGP